MSKTYDMENVSRGYDAKYEMVESVDHKGNPDGQGEWTRTINYDALQKCIDDATRLLLAGATGMALAELRTFADETEVGK